MIKYLLMAGLFCLPVWSFAQSVPEDAPARVLGGQQFELSKEAEAAGIDGILLVLIEVDKTGAVESARVVAGPSWPCDSTPSGELEKVRKAVEENVRTAKFSPEIKDGTPRGGHMFLKFAVGRAYRSAVKERDAKAAIEAGRRSLIVDSGVINGRAIRLAAPNIPSGSKFYGSISVSVLIDEQGNVIAAGAKAGPWAYQKEVRAAACDSKFSPTLIVGQPVRVTGVITYNFVQ